MAGKRKRRNQAADDNEEMATQKRAKGVNQRNRVIKGRNTSSKGKTYCASCGAPQPDPSNTARYATTEMTTITEKADGHESASSVHDESEFEEFSDFEGFGPVDRTATLPHTVRESSPASETSQRSEDSMSSMKVEVGGRPINKLSHTKIEVGRNQSNKARGALARRLLDETTNKYWQVNAAEAFGKEIIPASDKLMGKRFSECLVKELSELIPYGTSQEIAEHLRRGMAVEVGKIQPFNWMMVAGVKERLQRQGRKPMAIPSDAPRQFTLAIR